jgi:hypothetical protein
MKNTSRDYMIIKDGKYMIQMFQDDVLQFQLVPQNIIIKSCKSNKFKKSSIKLNRSIQNLLLSSFNRSNMIHNIQSKQPIDFKYNMTGTVS